MSEYINTITIPPQESAAALAQAMTTALGTALSWTADVDNSSVWQIQSGLRFVFYCTTNYVYIYATNSIVSYSQMDVSNRVEFYGGMSYCIDYIKTDDIVVAGIRPTGGGIGLGAFIAKNTNGEWKSFTLYTGSTTGVNIYYSATTYTSPKEWHAEAISNSAASTSLVRYPDPFGGCMFNNLYVMISCPSNLNDKVFYIGGKYFRFVGLGYSGFAVQVG